MNYYYITKLALIVSDEEIELNDYFITQNNNIHRCNKKNTKTLYFVTNSGVCAIENNNCKKIISGIPELPSINYSKLSPEEQNRLGWIDVDELADNAVFHILDDVERKIGFKEGLTHQLSIKRYTEEDMLSFLSFCENGYYPIYDEKGNVEHWGITNEDFERTKLSRKQLLKLWDKPELIPIEIEMEEVCYNCHEVHEDSILCSSIDGFDPKVLIPKITNNQITITKIL